MFPASYDNQCRLARHEYCTIPVDINSANNATGNVISRVRVGSLFCARYANKKKREYLPLYTTINQRKLRVHDAITCTARKEDCVHACVRMCVLVTIQGDQRR